MKGPLDARMIYQQNAARGATPLELVVILYDAAIEDMRRAMEAMKNNDVELKASAVGHALLVLQQLQGTLDFEKGGQPARQFEQFYNLVRAKLLEAHMRNLPELMEQQAGFLSEVRDCWVEAERQLRPKPALMPTAPPLPVDPGPEPAISTSGWRA